MSVITLLQTAPPERIASFRNWQTSSGIGLNKWDNRPSWDNKPPWDNRPSWDNWNKK
jgi:hypothetical protein